RAVLRGKTLAVPLQRADRVTGSGPRGERDVRTTGDTLVEGLLDEPRQPGRGEAREPWREDPAGGREGPADLLLAAHGAERVDRVVGSRSRRMPRAVPVTHVARRDAANGGEWAAHVQARAIGVHGRDRGVASAGRERA